MRVIQGYHSQALRLQMSLKRQNAMFYDVYTSLHRRKKASELMKSHTNLLRSALTSTSIEVAAPDKTGTTPLETAALRICLPKSHSETVLYKGQWVATPMGDAQIMNIRPAEEKIVLQLSYGQLYATLRQVIIWGGTRNLLQSDELLCSGSLRSRWQTFHNSGCLFLPNEVSMGIKALVGQEEDEPSTDGDDDSANDETSQKESSYSHHENNSNGSVIVKSGESGTSQDDAFPVPEFGAVETVSAAIVIPTKPEDPETVHSFPLKGCTSSSTSSSRQALKVLFSSDKYSLASQDSCTSGPFPLIFAPPGMIRYLSILCADASYDSFLYFFSSSFHFLPFFSFQFAACLPHLIENGQMNEEPRVRFCTAALSDSGQPGSSGSITWTGDLEKMAR